METRNGQTQRMDWRLPEQHFTGAPEEVASEIERLIVTLVACRQSIGVASQRRTVEPAGPAMLWRHLLAMLGLVLGG